MASFQHTSIITCQERKKCTSTITLVEHHYLWKGGGLCEGLGKLNTMVFITHPHQTSPDFCQHPHQTCTISFTHIPSSYIQAQYTDLCQNDQISVFNSINICIYKPLLTYLMYLLNMIRKYTCCININLMVVEV